MGSITFVPPSLGKRAASVFLIKIIVGALAPRPATVSGRAKTPASPRALTNHWVIQLVQNDRTSIRCDPRQSGPGAAPINIVFSEFDEETPSDLVWTYELPVRAGFTLDEFQDVIIRGNYRPYRFDESGQGCRYWIWALLGFFQENGIVTSAHRLIGARVCLQQVWTERGNLAEEEQQTHMVPGKFLEVE